MSGSEYDNMSKQLHLQNLRWNINLFLDSIKESSNIEFKKDSFQSLLTKFDELFVKDGTFDILTIDNKCIQFYFFIRDEFLFRTGKFMI
jgi:hypothetical protein